tara:strand:- start:658 stop:903 length:246 start_codon:yes stop_codon:yes gene_type:complete
MFTPIKEKCPSCKGQLIVIEFPHPMKRDDSIPGVGCEEDCGFLDDLYADDGSTSYTILTGMEEWDVDVDEQGPFITTGQGV